MCKPIKACLWLRNWPIDARVPSHGQTKAALLSPFSRLSPHYTYMKRETVARRASIPCRYHVYMRRTEYRGFGCSFPSRRVCFHFVFIHVPHRDSAFVHLNCRNLRSELIDSKHIAPSQVCLNSTQSVNRGPFRCENLIAEGHKCVSSIDVAFNQYHPPTYASFSQVIRHTGRKVSCLTPRP
jgi:hypothetical protein